MNAKIVKEGWLGKRGEYIKNWRNRYFYLLEDGSFIGYKLKPLDGPSDQSLNNFSIKRSQVLCIEKPKKNSFVIRCLQLTTLIERIFHCETVDERDEWVRLIKEVSEMATKNEKKEKNNGLYSEEVKNSTIVLEDYEMLKVLGHGTFGKVLLAKHRQNGNYFAIKILKKEMILEKDEVEHTVAEGRILKNLRHPFLTQMVHFFQTADRLFFVMEYVNGGELFFHMARTKIFPEERVALYAAEITMALQFLHEHKVVYRDLKLENLLLDSEGHIKLADFGLCKEEVGHADKTKTFCGTPEYLAPEIIEDSEYGPAVDWWALGIVVYECSCGRLPFYDKDHEVLFELIISKEVRFTHALSNVSKSFISGLLNKKPTQRLGGGPTGGEEVKDHPYFKIFDWDDVYHKRVTPVFVPNLMGPDDTKYFDEEFLNQEIKLTPPTKEVVFDFEI